MDARSRVAFRTMGKHSTLAPEIMMSEPRVEAVAADKVVVSNDAAGILGELVHALLAHPDEAQLEALLHGTLQSIRVSAKLVAERSGAVDLVRPREARPTWILCHASGVMATVSADQIEQLFEQAYEIRRAARAAAFPIDATLADGRYAIVAHIRGTPDRGMYQARESGSHTPLLVTLGPPQQLDLDAVRAKLALAVNGIAPLLHVGKLESQTEARYDGLVEFQPPGAPAADILRPPVDPRVAIELVLAIAKVVAAVHAAGAVVRGLRPELVYVQGGPAAPKLAGIAPRCEAFLTTAEARDYGVPPCFDNWYQAPEVLARPLDVPLVGADVFSLCAILAHWISGEHPFEGEGAMQLIAIVSGNRRAWRGPAPLGTIINAGLHASTEQRASLPEFVAALEAELIG
jgi:hypothetical protein